jgi:hypothetical protein
MSIVVLIPGILCIFVLLRGKSQAAFLKVFLPVLLLFPVAYTWTLRPIPPISFIIAVLLPLGVWMFLFDVHLWMFSRADLWMALFIFSSIYTDYQTGQTSASILTLFSVLVTGLIPYMAGKLLIEKPGMRIEVVKRFTWLLVISSILSMYEFFAKSNPFRRLWIKFFPDQFIPLETAIRRGFGRLGGPFGGGEQAGMVLLVGLCLAIWLGYRKYPDLEHSARSIISRKATKVIVLILGLALLMTQSRGPWVGAFIALCIASIGRAKQPLRRALIVFGLGILIGIPAYSAAKDYSSGPRTDYGSERETAQYRAQLIENYIPVATFGGAWGWGHIFPRIGGQASIDNEYLLVWLMQGYMGLLSIFLLLLEAGISLFRVGLRARLKRDRLFVFSLLGIILGIAVTIATVFLGSQPYELFFLLIGWSQAVRLSDVNKMDDLPALASQRTPAPALIRVYT